MNILQITPSYKPAFVYGGPIISISLLCENLLSSNQVTVFTTLANGQEELDYEPSSLQVIDGVNVLFFKRLIKGHTHFSYTLLTSLWTSCKGYDVVHIHSWWNATAILSAIICKIRNVKFIISPRGMFSEYSMNSNHDGTKRLLSSLFKRTLFRKQYFHATAENESDQISNLVKDAKVVVIPNFVKLYHNQTFVKKNNLVFQLIFLSRIDRKKGIEFIFNALKGLPFDAELVIVGDGSGLYINELKSLATAIGIENKIIWKGSVFSEEKYQLLANADLLILPSYDENFANVILEGLSVGTPVVISEKVGLVDFVKKHDLGWVCDLNSESLQNKIIESNTDEEKRHMINLTASKIVEEVFAPKNILGKYMNMYTKVIKNAK